MQPRQTSPSGRRGSNSRPQPWQGCALPTELRPPATSGVPLMCVRTVADAVRPLQNRPRACSDRVKCMRAWMNGELLPEPTGPAISVTDHGLTVGRRGVRGDQGRSTGSRSRWTCTCERLARSLRAWVCRTSTTRRYAAASAAVLDATRTCRSAGSGSPTPAGPAPLGSGRGDAPPTLVVVADADGARSRRRPRWRRCRGRATSGARWPGSRPRRTPRTSSRSPRPQRARRHRGDLRQPRRPPVRGHRLQRLLRRRRRAAHPHAGQRLPRRRHPRAGAGVVRRPRGRRADRGGRPGERGVPGVDHPRRPGRAPLGRPRARRARADHHGRRGGLARAGAGAAGF